MRTAAAPERAWFALLVAALVVAAAGSAGLELFWRARGHVPSVTDDADLWALERARAATADARTLTLVGYSRLQLGFDPATFHARHPDLELINLTAQARLPLAVLRDLARDEGFRGRVLVDVVELAFLPESIEEQESYVRHARQAIGPARAWERRLTTPLQEHLVLLNPGVGLLRVLQSGGTPTPLYVTTRADRSRSADYAAVDAERQARERLAGARRRYAASPAPSPETWSAWVDEVEAWAARIRARGGDVAFVRMPVGAERLALDESVYPRSRYWDPWAARSPSIVLRSEDVPALAAFRCPDGSHLDGRDAPAFTAALLDVLAARGFLPAR